MHDVMQNGIPSQSGQPHRKAAAGRGGALHHGAGQPRVGRADADDDLHALVHSITSVEAIVAGWSEEQILTVQALKSAIEDLHRQALRRLIRALKNDPAAGPRLRGALEDPVVYGVLRFHGLVKVPLLERVHRALEEVRPALSGHGGGVELVAIKPPDTVELRLTGSCHGCPASSQTLTEGVERAIRAHCPEILHIHQVSRSAPAAADDGSAIVHFVSPFARQSAIGWLDAGALADLRESGVTARSIAGRPVLLAKCGGRVRCFDNACAHLGFPLDMGDVSGGVITCNHHGFEYLLDTGECLTAPEVRLKTHAVRITGSRVQVRLGD